MPSLLYFIFWIIVLCTLGDVMLVLSTFSMKCPIFELVFPANETFREKMQKLSVAAHSETFFPKFRTFSRKINEAKTKRNFEKM